MSKSDQDEQIENLQRQIDVLRNDFQQLETLYHTTREVLEARIEAFEDEIKSRAQ